MARKKQKKQKTQKKLPRNLGGGKTEPAYVNGPVIGNEYDLNPKQFRFFCGLIAGRGMFQSYLDAGYKGKHSAAASLMANRKVRKAVEKWKKANKKKAELTRAEILKELAKIAMFDIRKFLLPDGSLKNLVDLGDCEAAAVSGMTLTTIPVKRREGDSLVDTGEFKTVPKSIQLLNKESALINYGKHLQLFLPAKTAQEEDIEKITQMMKEASQEMVKTLPISGQNVLKGHFGKKKKQA